MSTEENKTKITRYIEEVFNKGNLFVVDETVMPNYIVHTGLGIEIKGPEGVKQFCMAMRTGFPDLKGEIEHLVAEKNMVAYRMRWRGTHKGDAFGHAPTGRQVTWVEVTFLQFTDGMLTEAWALGDRFGLFQQLKPA
jgi:predicted ester cyclase